MPTVEQLRMRLIEKLKELFQLDQPDLDFGFFRVMHAKAKQVSEFLEIDLLKIIGDAFGGIDESQKAGLKKAYEDAIETAKKYGAPDPEKADAVCEARARYEAAGSTAKAEAEVYDHLYRFFERYYDNGDFISLRYYSRETSEKAAPFAIPYNGEEVKLHWANADQYYIKTSEYFSNFTFDLRQANEVKEATKGTFWAGVEQKPLRVHFRIVEATEWERGNIKATEEARRFFIIHKEDPAGFDESGELVVHFEYRPDPDKGSTQEGTWREHRNAEAVQTIFKALNGLAGTKDYLNLFKIPAPTEKQKDRTLLAKYLNKYTTRNTFDYFIHKDLGGFLRRELDFYIKNEVMRLDDIESAQVPAVESYLSRIRVLRRIAHKIIDLLAQLEDFQKKLWLKRKFVVETNYCITLDRVPEELYPEIAANEAQRAEWVRLFAIDAVEGDLSSSEQIGPLTFEFLKANSKLVLDTQFFEDVFKSRVIASIENFDEQCDGLLLNSENFQALNFLQVKYKEGFEIVYIDPPYNSDASSIMYKNDYKNSSWISLMQNRLLLASYLMSDTAILCCAIDDMQVSEAKMILDRAFSKTIGVAVVRSNPQSRKTKGTFSPSHEYALFFGRTTNAIPGSLEITEKRRMRYPLQDDKGSFAWMNLIRTGTNDRREDRPKLYYPIYVDDLDNIRIPSMTWSSEDNEYILNEPPSENEVAIYPITKNGEAFVEKNWHRGHSRILSEPDEYRVRRDAKGKINIDFKTRMDESSTPVTWWDKNEYASANYGAAELKELFGDKPFDFPKAKKLVEDCIRASGASNSRWSE